MTPANARQKDENRRASCVVPRAKASHELLTRAKFIADTETRGECRPLLGLRDGQRVLCPLPKKIPIEPAQPGARPTDERAGLEAREEWC